MTTTAEGRLVCEHCSAEWPDWYGDEFDRCESCDVGLLHWESWESEST